MTERDQGPLTDTILDIFSLSEDSSTEFGKAMVCGVLGVISVVALGGMKTAFMQPEFERVAFAEPCITVPLGIIVAAMVGLAFIHGVVATK